jgi:hypothetical protein
MRGGSIWQVTSKMAEQETAEWTRENGKASSWLVGWQREMAAEVAVEPESCSQKHVRKQFGQVWEML